MGGLTEGKEKCVGVEEGEGGGREVMRKAG